MKPMEALALWARACGPTGVSWYLYRETLLCANGYHHFPENLTTAQIAVQDKDLTLLWNEVFPALPDRWTLDKGAFVGSRRQLVFRDDEGAVLEIHVLYETENETRLEEFSDSLKAATVKARRAISLRKLANRVGRKLFGRLYTCTIGALLNRGIRKRTDRAFRQVLSLSMNRDEKREFCGSCGSSILLKLPLTAEALTVDGVDYPVFSGYREYLAAAFGDYEKGLFDEIGTGLTVAEKEELKNHQARCFEALSFLQEVSREFGLRYYLLAGSVLGAVRHGGFIPWDDDIDVGIRIEELEHFESVIRDNFSRLPEGFTLMQSGANNPYPRMFSKICYNGRCCIDLWPLVPTYRSGFKAVYHWYFGKIITKIHYHKIGHTVGKFHTIARLGGLVMNDRMVMALARRNERRYAGRSTPAYINLYSIYHRSKEAIDRTWLDDGATALFNGLEVPVVGHTDSYLTHLYGDYMAFPAPWKRGSRHVVRF